jgi:hypothetical protein
MIGAAIMLAAIATFMLASIGRHTRSTTTPRGERPRTSATQSAGVHGARELQPHTAGVEPQHEPARSTAADQAVAAPEVRAQHEARARRDALRASIARAGANGPSSLRAPDARDSGQRADPADRPGTLVDRVGGREALVAHLNQEFMPLARECIEQALAREPQLKGMLALSVETVAHVELGGVIDVAEVGEGNQVHERELHECIRETALTVSLPAPLVTGREKFMLTLKVGMGRTADARDPARAPN